MYCFIGLFAGIISIPVIRLIGCRGSIILGGFIAALGPALAVFVKGLAAICLTMGLLTGEISLP